MKKFEVLNEHEIPENVEGIVENKFGDCSIEDSTYIVEEPDYNIIESVEIEILRSEYVVLDIDEVSVEKAKKNGLLSEVEDAMQSKNDLLRKLTGKTVEDRKEDIRQSVLDDPDPKT